MRPALLALACLAASLTAAEPAPQPPAPTPPAPKPAPAPVPPAPQPEVKPAPAPAPESKPAAAAATAAAAAPKKKTVAEVVKGHRKVGGLFELHLDPEKGGLHLYVRKDQIGPEFIYFNHTVDGVVQAGHNRGRYGDARIFRIARSFDRLEFIEDNTAFHFDPQSPLARTAKANTSHAILASEGIAAEDEGGFLIPAGNLFLRETLLMIKPSGNDGGKAVLGRLSEVKTKVLQLKGYPDNVAVLAEYVYENPAPSWSGDTVRPREITDPRYVSIKIQHSLIRMPDNDFKPRRDDPRIGYFTTQVTDMTSTDATPYRDVIHRWHLVKQKPGTALSEPVQPIVFWIENTTPVEVRDLVRDAALRWNRAFETAGFKDALVIRQQPDNAAWEAGDINYNVLRWTSSPNPPFSGYGPSFVNPRTGQILGADIMLEFSFLTNRLRSERLFTELGLASAEPAPAELLQDPKACLDARFAQQGLLFAGTALRLRAASPLETKAMTREALAKLILHEIGHTLGLNHNFRASHLHDPVSIHKKEVTAKTALTGSVMDYMPANLAPDGTPQGEFYITQPGPYDHWAIEYGYSEALEDPAQERLRLQKIAGRSHEPALAFANDADDMRRAGKGIDPRAMLYDMSSDPVTYGAQRCELVRSRLADLLKKEPKPGESWHSLTQAYVTLTSESANALTAISRYVGGVYVERAFVGQAPDRRPYTPVDKGRQLAALAALNRHAFAPDAWKLPEGLAAHLQQQRRGFDFFKEDEAPRLHDRISQLQRSLLDHLLHVETQRRILDSRLYGNELPLDAVMAQLTSGVFEGDPASGPDSLRQNLQADYVDRLLRIANGGGAYLPAAQAVAYGEIEKVKQRLEAPAFQAVPAHRRFLQYKIKRGLDE